MSGKGKRLGHITLKRLDKDVTLPLVEALPAPGVQMAAGEFQIMVPRFQIKAMQKGLSNGLLFRYTSSLPLESRITEEIRCIVSGEDAPLAREHKGHGRIDSIIGHKTERIAIPTTPPIAVPDTLSKNGKARPIRSRSEQRLAGQPDRAVVSSISTMKSAIVSVIPRQNAVPLRPRPKSKDIATYATRPSLTAPGQREPVTEKRHGAGAQLPPQKSAQKKGSLLPLKIVSVFIFFIAVSALDFILLEGNTTYKLVVFFLILIVVSNTYSGMLKTHYHLDMKKLKTNPHLRALQRGTTGQISVLKTETTAYLRAINLAFLHREEER